VKLELLGKKIAGRNRKEYWIDTDDSCREKRKQYHIDRAKKGNNIILTEKRKQYNIDRADSCKKYCQDSKPKSDIWNRKIRNNIAEFFFLHF